MLSVRVTSESLYELRFKVQQLNTLCSVWKRRRDNKLDNPLPFAINDDTTLLII